MRKKIARFMIAGVLVSVLGFVSTPARAELSLGPTVSYYSPNFGKVNDDLEEANAIYGTDLGFRAGIMYGLALEYDLGPRFGLRLEYDRFESKTRDTGSYIEDSWDYRLDIDLKLTVTPVMLSLIYGFSPAYIGTGLGSFVTKVKRTYTYEEYFNESLVYRESGTDSDSDSPTGLVLLAGFKLGDKATFFNVEVRYVVSTKAKIEDFDTKVDLSGLQLSLLAGLEF